jgi:CMP-2-keto-3-deoxyoctulosonic acid synthetase
MSDPIQSVFDACSFEENKLAMVIQDASPSIEKRSVARILSELRFHARASMQNQIRQNQERAQVCLLQTEIR